MRSGVRPVCIALPVLLMMMIFLSEGETFSDQKERIIIVILDGARQATFEKLLQEGKLPVMNNLASEGTFIENGVSVFPSTTGPAYAPFVTGNLAGKSWLPGIRWFDRVRGIFRVYCGTDNGVINEDLNPAFKTIYEILPAGESVVVFGFTDRGVPEGFKKMPVLDLAYPKLAGDLKQMDKVLADTFWKLYEEKNYPRYAFVSLHAPDGAGHDKGGNSNEYEEAIEYHDLLVGELVDRLKSRGLFQDTTLILSADHGIEDVDKGCDMQKLLSEVTGLSVENCISRVSQTFNFKNKLGLENFDAIFAVSGNAFVMLYVKKPGARDMKERPSYEELISYPVMKNGVLRKVNLIEAIVSLEQVRMVFAREKENLCHVYSKKGHSIIERNGKKLRYTVVEGQDPFEYGDEPSFRGAYGIWLDNRKWLEATARTRYPDALFQVISLFDAPGTGDMVFVAERGWEPWNEGQKGVHGSLEELQFKVPIIIRGPSIKKCRFFTARTADLFPLSLRILGYEIPEGIDGVTLPIIEKKKSNVVSSKASLAVIRAAKMEKVRILEELVEARREESKNLLRFFRSKSDRERKLEFELETLSKALERFERTGDSRSAKNVMDVILYRGGISATRLKDRIAEKKKELEEKSIFSFVKNIFLKKEIAGLEKLLEARKTNARSLAKILSGLEKKELFEVLDNLARTELVAYFPKAGRRVMEAQMPLMPAPGTEEVETGEVLFSGMEEINSRSAGKASTGITNNFSREAHDRYVAAYSRYVEVIGRDDSTPEERNEALARMEEARQTYLNSVYREALQE